MSTREDGNPKPVTVKIIETVYVEADTADDFKSVVQRLTGKDAAVAAELEESNRPAAPPQAAQQGSLGDRKTSAGASSKRRTGER
ncbi:hypothetical protein BDA96_09G253800 [Sorghum bicolor]|jgi:hypothetical protein|uniref:VQ domain-containing protein n=2 Tax=Sorghum bicolor TaxID=4558 RepID=A0A921QCK6_SORBI|nr:hypothetical protein BDA96_09G253800 [Sorghum bicolor]OQU78467.1 hypothetical protein SORBI_3009G239700 [Sorghum bicolor]